MIDIGAQLLQKDYLKSQHEGRRAASKKASYLQNIGYLGSAIGTGLGMMSGLGPVAMGLGGGLGGWLSGHLGASKYEDPITKFAVAETEHGLEKTEKQVLPQALQSGMAIGGAAYGIGETMPGVADALNFGKTGTKNYLASAMNYSPFAGGAYPGLIPKVGLAGLLALYMANERGKI